MTAKQFLLVHTFNDLSKLGEGESYYSDIEIRHNIPWKIQVFKKDKCLGLNLHCEKEECSETTKWTIQTKFTMKLVAVGGKIFQQTVQHEFQKPEAHGMDKFISWENMLRDYVDEDSIIIEIHADIVSGSGVVEQACLPNLPADAEKSFVLKHTFKNLSRFVEEENEYSDVEVHYNIPWKIELQKSFGFLGIYLHRDKFMCEDREHLIEGETELKLIGAKCSAVLKKAFGYGFRCGRAMLIEWNGIETDSLDVEICVKITNVTDYPCTEKTFVLSHTIKNVSSVEEGGYYNTDIQTRFDIPWRMKIEKQNGFLGLYLYCEREDGDLVGGEFQLKLVSPNGKSVSIEKCGGNGWDMLLRWDVLEKDYLVNDTIIVEARVWIRKITGMEDDNAIMSDVDRRLNRLLEEYELEVARNTEPSSKCSIS